MSHQGRYYRKMVINGRASLLAELLKHWEAEYCTKCHSLEVQERTIPINLLVPVLSCVFAGL